jgi:hypothetical protein
MKVLILNLNEKNYTTGKITTYLSKEALKIQKDALALGKKGNEVQKDTENLEAIDELLTALVDLKDRKTWLICEMYGNKFTADELEKALDDDEIDSQINSIISGICGVITKN